MPQAVDGTLRKFALRVPEVVYQCSGIMVLSNVPDPENYSTYFMKIDGVKFKRKIIPGDTLHAVSTDTEPLMQGNQQTPAGNLPHRIAGLAFFL